jgi:hypothetical protein
MVVGLNSIVPGGVFLPKSGATLYCDFVRFCAAGCDVENRGKNYITQYCARWCSGILERLRTALKSAEMQRTVNASMRLRGEFTARSLRVAPDLGTRPVPSGCSPENCAMLDGGRA